MSDDGEIPSRTEAVVKNSKDTFCLEKFKKKCLLLTLTLVLLLAIIGILFHEYRTSEISMINTFETSTTNGLDTWTTNTPESSTIRDQIHAVRFISRSEWIAQPPDRELALLALPAKRVIIAYTATENCTTQASCSYRVRMIQTFHIDSRGWDDIVYNFLVGGDGAIYVGRGWNVQGAHTKGYNVNSICIAFIGNFNKIEPPKAQLYAAQKLIEEGVKLKKLTSDYALYGQRQLIPSESPGLALYKIIKKWDHWTEDVV